MDAITFCKAKPDSQVSPLHILPYHILYFIAYTIIYVVLASIGYLTGFCPIVTQNNCSFPLSSPTSLLASVTKRLIPASG